MFNKVILVGNLTKDIELRYSQSSMAIGSSSIAVNKRVKDAQGNYQEKAMFVDVTFFGKTAEVANQYLKRGSKVLVEGELDFQQWQDQNGQKRSKHAVIVNMMEMLDSKQDSQNNQQNGGYPQQQQHNNYNNQQGGYDNQQPQHNANTPHGQQPPVTYHGAGADDETIPF